MREENIKNIGIRYEVACKGIDNYIYEPMIVRSLRVIKFLTWSKIIIILFLHIYFIPLSFLS